MFGHVNAWSDANRYKRALASTWPNTAGKTYWMSYLLDMKTVPQPNTYFMVKLYYTTDLLSSSGELVALGKGGGATTPVFTCGSGWPGSSGDDVSSVPVAAGPVRLVARFDMSGGANSRTYMWVDPDPSKAPDTTKAAVKRWTGMQDGFNAVALEYGGDVSTTPIVFVMDAIRIANSYAGLTSSAITGVNQSAAVRPAEFSLSQNYPNPFNPTTEINYSLRTTGQVRLSVYNILGCEVITLVDGVQAAGAHTVHFAGAGLASGMVLLYITIRRYDAYQENVVAEVSIDCLFELSVQTPAVKQICRCFFFCKTKCNVESAMAPDDPIPSSQSYLISIKSDGRSLQSISICLNCNVSLPFLSTEQLRDINHGTLYGRLLEMTPCSFDSHYQIPPAFLPRKR